MRADRRLCSSAVLFVTLLMGGCIGRGLPSGIAGQAGEIVPEDRALILELIHRDARLEDGRLAESAVTELADRAIEKLTGEEFPLDGWALLIPEEGTLTVLATPEEGPLARAVVGRARLAAGRDGAVNLAGDGETPSSGPVLWVVETGWRDPGLTLDPAEVARARYPETRFVGVLADLLEPRINGKPWRADALLAAIDPATATLGLRHILGARRRGETGDPAKEAVALNLEPGSIDWVSEVIAR